MIALATMTMVTMQSCAQGLWCQYATARTGLRLVVPLVASSELCPGRRSKRGIDFHHLAVGKDADGLLAQEIWPHEQLTVLHALAPVLVVKVAFLQSWKSSNGQQHDHALATREVLGTR